MPVKLPDGAAGVCWVEWDVKPEGELGHELGWEGKGTRNQEKV